MLSDWVVPEKIHTPPTDGILEILAGGGVKGSGNPGGRGGWTLKSLPQGSFQPIIQALRTLNSVTLQLSQTLKKVEIFLFKYFSPDINDNLSSFTGPCIAENAKTRYKIKEEPVTTLLERRSWNAWHISTRLTHFYSYPDLARHRCVISR